jgi:hypothetical protein
MGGAVKSAGDFLGLGSGPEGPSTGNLSLQKLNNLSKTNSTPELGALKAQLMSGQIGNDEALKRISQFGSGGRGGADYGDYLDDSMSSLATDPISGSRFATNEVQSNPILSQLFGKGGALENAVGKEQELQNRGFKLTDDDREAYGQASGDIARMFGESENNAAQSLAQRGLASAPSGAAGAMFSGLQGNKNEQLAKAQMSLANNRMQNTMQRIGQQQSFINSLGGQGQQAIQSQYGRQLGGAENKDNRLMKTAGLQNQQYQNELAGEQFKQDNKPANFMDYISAGTGEGLQSSAKMFNSASTYMGGGMGGGGGGMMGGMMGGK